jgi:polysaccharide pyruvyl transferase WcaK-like protein
MPKILMLSDVTGLGPDYHVGDEAMVEVAIQRLATKIGKENLVVGCANPEQIYPTYGVRAFAFYHTPDRQFYGLILRRPLSFLKAIVVNLYQIARCDKVIICGGGNMTSVWPDVLESRLRLLRLANFFRKDVYLVSQTLGPYQKQHQKRVQSVLGKAKWLGVRDINFSRAQVSLPVHFALDDANFLDAKHNDETRELSEQSGPFACVSMRKFGPMDDQDVLRVAGCIHAVTVKENVDTIFIPHHAPGGVGGDIKLAHNIKHVWADEKFSIVDPIPLASALKALTADAKLVITMRYHQLIFALSMGVPAVGIYVDEYTQAKLSGAFEALGLKPLVTSVYEVEGQLQSLVDAALGQRADFQSAAETISGEARTVNEQPYRMISDELSSTH